MAKPKHTYKLKYNLKTWPGEYSAEEIKESGQGGTDAFLMFSIIYPEDGSLSVQHTSVDGRNGGKELDGRELFKMWMLLGTNLAKRDDLDELRREIASFPAASFFAAIRGTK